MYSQCKKLSMKKEDDEKVEDDATTVGSLELPENEDRTPRPNRCIWWYNFKDLWKFRPQSQAYLYKQLFGEEDPSTLVAQVQTHDMSASNRYSAEISSMPETAAFPRQQNLAGSP
jgi:hypothetical protein